MLFLLIHDAFNIKVTIPGQRIYINKSKVKIEKVNRSLVDIGCTFPAICSKRKSNLFQKFIKVKSKSRSLFFTEKFC